MAVDATSKVQSALAPFKPSVAASHLQIMAGDFRNHHCHLIAAAQIVFNIEAPWAGVIEEVKSTQVVAGGGAAQNSVTLTSGGTNCYAAAGDGNTFLGNATASTSALNYPTDNLTLQDDGEYRVEFNKGDNIILTSVGANHGTVQYEMKIAQKMPHSI